MEEKVVQRSGRTASQPKELKFRHKRPPDSRVSRQRHGSTIFITRSVSTATNNHTATNVTRPSASRLRFIHNGVADPLVWEPTANPLAAPRQIVDEGGEAHRNPRTLFFRTEDSTWCFQPSSADVACRQLGIWDRICRQMRILPLWSTYQVPKHLSEATAGNLKTGLDLAPDLFYPFDKIGILSFNPMRETVRYIWIPKSSGILTTSLMMGCLLEDVRICRKGSRAFYALLTAAYQIISDMIDAKERSQVLSDQAAMFICKMALTANLCGNYDDWRRHMLGLKALLDNRRLRKDLDESIACNAIYLTDIEGALAAGQPPILDFQRRFPLLEPNLANDKLKALRQGLNSLTLAAHLPVVTRKMMLSVSILTHTILNAKALKATYHPHHISETFWGLNYELILQPSPLFPDPRTKALGAHQSERLTPKLDILGGIDEATTSLDISVRIATLLYFREPMAEVVFSKSGYPQLLSRLAAQLVVLLAWVRKVRKMIEYPEAVEFLQAEEVSENFQNQHEWHNIATARLQAVRPFLTWAAVLGYLYTLRMGLLFQNRRVFRDIIVELCRGVPEKLTKDDLSLFKPLDMNYVSVGKWDLKTTLQHIVDQEF